MNERPIELELRLISQLVPNSILNLPALGGHSSQQSLRNPEGTAVSSRYEIGRKERVQRQWLE